MEAERFDVNAYLRCDCASVENQTCDKCAVRGHIASLSRELEDSRVSFKKRTAEFKQLANDWAAERDALASLKREVLEDIDAEPELPGPMPEELRFSSNTEDFMRAAVRATKKGIRVRVEARLSRAMPGEEDTQP